MEDEPSALPEFLTCEKCDYFVWFTYEVRCCMKPAGRSVQGIHFRMHCPDCGWWLHYFIDPAVFRAQWEWLKEHGPQKN